MDAVGRLSRGVVEVIRLDELIEVLSSVDETLLSTEVKLIDTSILINAYYLSTNNTKLIVQIPEHYLVSTNRLNKHLIKSIKDIKEQ